jgi:hypothetical protein
MLDTWPITNLIPVIRVDFIIHSPGTPFCFDQKCPCHSDWEAKRKLCKAHRDGLITRAERDRIFRGEQA